MAEKFNNYLVSAACAANRKFTIVPTQGTSLQSLSETGVNASSGQRVASSTSQIHSIYLTKSNVTSIDSNPEANGIVASISVYDSMTSQEYYIAKAVNVLPNSSFYIEKTITLRPQDAMKVTIHNSPASTTIDVVCSGVDLT